jgi:outer membrane protein TolC
MMKKMAYFSLVCCTALLGACADMGNIKPHATQLDANKLGGVQVAAREHAEQWPQAQWWKVYGDAQLNTLIDNALKDNPDLHIAEARVRQAQSLAGLAESATMPNIEASTSMTRQLFSQHDFIPPPEAGNYAWYNRAAIEAPTTWICGAVSVRRCLRPSTK